MSWLEITLCFQGWTFLHHTVNISAQVLFTLLIGLSFIGLWNPSYPLKSPPPDKVCFHHNNRLLKSISVMEPHRVPLQRRSRIPLRTSCVYLSTLGMSAKV